MTFKDFFRGDIPLIRYKVRDLQKIARYNLVSTIGPKRAIVPRLERFFMLSFAANHIQKFVRGALCRIVLNLRKIQTNIKTNCKNATDFYTMESVDEIPSTLFVTYTDTMGFNFAFNVYSLMAYYKIKGVFINPYNREEFLRDRIISILRFFLLSVAVFKEDIEKYVIKYSDATTEEGCRELGVLYKMASRVYAIEFALYSSKICKRSRANSLSFTNEPNIIEIRNAVRETVIEVRSHEIYDRINIVFNEINNLGNYTSPNWFTDLEKIEYIRFYNYIYNVWRYRGGIPLLTKESICCLGDPFNHRFVLRYVYSENAIDRIRELCISLIEELVFTGINTDFRQLGALHVLTALTLVSTDARENLPWLFESII